MAYTLSLYMPIDGFPAVIMFDYNPFPNCPGQPTSGAILLASNEGGPRTQTGEVERNRSTQQAHQHRRREARGNEVDWAG